MASDSELPTWAQIEDHVLFHLDEARNQMSEVRDWLKSDWRPLGSPPPAGTGSTRVEVLRIVGEVKNLIDQAKDTIYRGVRR